MSKLDESRAILKAFGMPTEQQNETAGYTLLALTNLKVNASWSQAVSPMLRIHDMLDFIRDIYHKDYAENSRETFRRKVLHQLETARIVDRNPDDPKRPTNSGKTCYALTDEALAVIQSYGTDDFLTKAAEFQRQQKSLLDAYRAEKGQHAVEIQLPEGVMAFLSPGRHNELQAAIIKEFWPRFIPHAKLLYLGDTANKSYHVEEDQLKAIGLPFSSHDKFPDVVFHLEQRKWLVLVEAVTSHGPVSEKRRAELEAMLKSSSLDRIYVTAFPSRKEYKQHLDAIAWETEVWLADNPAHMIHFNGPKFLGPVS